MLFCFLYFSSPSFVSALLFLVMRQRWFDFLCKNSLRQIFAHTSLLKTVSFLIVIAQRVSALSLTCRQIFPWKVEKKCTNLTQNRGKKGVFIWIYCIFICGLLELIIFRKCQSSWFLLIKCCISAFVLLRIYLILFEGQFEMLWIWIWNCITLNSRKIRSFCWLWKLCKVGEFSKSTLLRVVFANISTHSYWVISRLW